MLVAESTTRINQAVTLLATLGDHGALGGEQIQQIETVSNSAGQIGALAQEALELPPDDLEGKRALADQMEPHLMALLESAESFADFAAIVSASMLPETGLDRDGFGVSVEAEGDPHSSTDFSVAGSLADGG